MTYKYEQKLPKEVDKALDQYIERIRAIKWFKPDPSLKKETVDTKVNAALSAFGVSASIEYRQLKKKEDWDAARDADWYAAWDAARDAAWDAAWDAARDAAWGAARDAARDAAWDAARGAAWDAAWDAARGAARDAAWGAARDAAWDAAWGAADILATFTTSYKKDTPFVKLVEIWELGMYPVGVVDGKFVVYTPIDFAVPQAKEIEDAPEEIILNGVRYVRADKDKGV